MGHLKKWAANILLMIFSLVIFFGALEGLTRLLWDYEVSAPHVGAVVDGGDRVVVHEGIEYRTNVQGLRNREISGDKPEQTKRILVLGDSFIWGDGISADELITHHIEVMLGGYGQGIEVVNTGKGGINTTEEFARLKKYAPIVQPDLVMLFFFTNDVLRVEPKQAESAGKSKASSWRQRLKETLRRNSKFMAYLYYQYKSNYAAKFGVPEYLLPQDYFNLDESKPGWVAFKQAVQDIQQYCYSRDIKLLFVSIPTLTSLNENYPYSEMRSKVTEYVDDRNIPQIDLFDVLAPYEPVDIWVSPENTHWNNKATLISAETVVQFVNQQGLLD